MKNIKFKNFFRKLVDYWGYAYKVSVTETLWYAMLIPMSDP